MLTVPSAERHRARHVSGLWLIAAAVLLGAGWGSNQFTPMLLVYRRTLGLGTGTLEALFGFYALGLVPGLLLAGPLSDSIGRRKVVVPAAALSLAGSVTLVAGAHEVALLFTGRFIAGISNGAAFAAGTAWLRELSLPPLSSGTAAVAARRAAVGMTAGFAAGPLASGVLAQWAPAPAVVPYVPHIALMAAVLLWLPAVPETRVLRARPRLRPAFPGIRAARFRRVVAPTAPWVFAAPAIAFALLPSVTGVPHATDGIALTSGITALTALAGVLVQPIAHRLDARVSSGPVAALGLLACAVGLAVGAVTAATEEIWLLLPCAVILGCGYGLCLVAGLTEVQRLAAQASSGGLTAAYYMLTYVGFSLPYALALAHRVADYPVLLTITAVLAVATAGLVTHRSTEALPETQGPVRAPSEDG